MLESMPLISKRECFYVAAPCQLLAPPVGNDHSRHVSFTAIVPDTPGDREVRSTGVLLWMRPRGAA
jgi:hypothetical protein